MQPALDPLCGSSVNIIKETFTATLVCRPRSKAERGAGALEVTFPVLVRLHPSTEACGVKHSPFTEVESTNNPDENNTTSTFLLK